MRRAARLVVALEKLDEAMTCLSTMTPLTQDQANAILTEMLRAELAALLARYESGALFAVNPDLLDETLAGDADRLKQAARARDFSDLLPGLAEAARTAGVTLADPLPTALGIQAASLKREVLEVTRAACDLEDPRKVAAPLVARFSDQDVASFVKHPVSLEAAIAKTFDLYPSKEMRGNINAIASLATYFFGVTTPVTAITPARQEEFFRWMARLPKSHGKAHGRNRYSKTGVTLDKNEEIAAADTRDRAVIDEIRQMDLSIPEKRALLAERLTPRLTETTILRNRDGLKRIFKAAEALGCSGLPAVLGYRDIKRIVKAAEVSDDALHMRVTRPKIRMPWSAERLATFLKSPLFTGHASPHRRWKPGSVITRDGFYWIPLFWLALGTRHEELVLAKRAALAVRNGIWGLWFGEPADLPGKSRNADRFLPIPKILLELGFVDWVHGLPDDHGPLLFPEVACRSRVGKSAESFSRALGRIIERLGLKDFDEDFYALRKTFLSMLRANDVPDGMREAIAGHRGGTVLNRHYRAHETAAMKEAIDSVDFGIAIEQCPGHGFPVIRDCTLGGSVELEASLELVTCSPWSPRL